MAENTSVTEALTDTNSTGEQGTINHGEMTPEILDALLKQITLATNMQAASPNMQRLNDIDLTELCNQTLQLIDQTREAKRNKTASEKGQKLQFSKRKLNLQ